MKYTRKKDEPVKWSSPLEYAFYVGLFVSTSKIVWVKHCHMVFYECCNIESLICWLTKHIWDMGLRLVVCWRRLLAKWKHWSSLRPLWPSYAPPCRPPRASWALFWQPQGSWLPSPWRSHVILGEWPGVTSCLLSAPAISDQMVTWENPACFADKSPSKLSWLHCCWWQCSQRRRSTPTTYPTILLCLCLRTGFHLPWASREGVLGGLLC